MTIVQPPQHAEPHEGPVRSPDLTVRPQDGAPHADQAPGTKGRAWIWITIVVVLLVAGGIYFVVSHFKLLASTGAAKGAKAGARTIPVVTATARKGDLNLYLSSLGTVTAFQTVTVRTRVDGELMKVFYTEGQIVREGDPLVEIDPRPYEVQRDQAMGQIARDQATLNQAKLDLERDRKLSATKAISPQQLDAQVSTAGQYEGAVKTDQAMIDNAKLQIDYCHITAPISGRIGLRLVDKGNFVQASGATSLAVITQLQPIAVIFTIPQDDIYRVQQKFASGEDVPVEAWNRDIKKKLASGKLLAIDNLVDTTTGTVRLKAVFQNEDNTLFPNEFVNAKLLIDTRHGAVIVPSSAVQRGPKSTFAFVVKADKKVEMRDLKVGPTEGDQTIVTSGISAGEIVVTEGTDKLGPDSKVETRGPEASGKAKPKTAGTANKGAAKAAQ